MRRRRQVLAAAVALRALQAAPKPAPPAVFRTDGRRQLPAERVVERIVTERVVEPPGPDLSGPLAAVDKRARRALEAVEDVGRRVDDAIGAVQKAQEIADGAKNEVSALRQEVQEALLAEAPVPPPAPEPPAAVDAPSHTQVAELLGGAVGPLAERFESLAGELRQRVTGLSRIVDEARSDARHATSVAANVMSRDIPQPPQLPDFLVSATIHNGHLLGVMHSGKTKDFGQVVFKPRVVGGGRASSKQMQEWSAQSAGGGDVLLTYAAPTQATVDSTASDIVASGSATFRRVTISVPSTADVGIYCNPAGAATSTCWLVKSGASGVWDTNQAISAIRAGGTDVIAQAQVGSA